MAKIKKTIALVLAGSAVSMIFAACAQLDVVGQQSIASFKAVLDASGDIVKADESNFGWSLTAPDDSARFIWSEDYSISPIHDVMLEFDAQPFLDAGLDTSKLPDNYVFYEGETAGGMGSKKLMVGTKLGTDKIKYSGEPTPLSAYEQIVGKYRASINYHTALDHYGVMLGDGNMFEWAKDLKTNSNDNSVQDKDIVFVLNPEPLTAAGVDPEKVEGWVYAQVPVEEGGK